MDDIDLFGPEMLADPYPVYHRLRSTDPVHWHEPFQAWVVTRYDDVLACLHDSRLSSPLDFAYPLPFTDPPRHTPLRGLFKAFTPGGVEAMAPRIEGWVAEWLDAARGRAGMDVIRDLAYPLPGTVICRMLGLPVEDLERFKRWSDDFLLFFGNAPPGVTAADYRRAAKGVREQTAYFLGLLPRLRNGRQGGLLCALERVQVGGDRLSESELYATAQTLVFAGRESTTDLIGGGLLALLRHPAQMRKLCDDLTLIPRAVEEFLRYDGPAQFVRRQAREDLELRGKEVREGHFVVLVLAAANRDPEQFPEPDALDITRNPNKHLGFGQGIHSCLGVALPRLEARIALEGLLRRFPRLRLGPEPLQYEPSFNRRGLKSLPVSFG